MFTLAVPESSVVSVASERGEEGTFRLMTLIVPVCFLFRFGPE